MCMCAQKHTCVHAYRVLEFQNVTHRAVTVGPRAHASSVFPKAGCAFVHLRVCALVSQAKARLSIPGSRWSEQTGLPRTKTAFFPILAHLPRIFPPTPAHRSLRAGPQICRVYLGTHVCTNCSYPHFLHGSPWKSSANMAAFLPPVDEDGSLIRPR